MATLSGSSKHDLGRSGRSAVQMIATEMVAAVTWVPPRQEARHVWVTGPHGTYRSTGDGEELQVAGSWVHRRHRGTVEVGSCELL